MSNKKTLLNEGTIRRFMKLANVDALTENYFENKAEEEEEEEEEEVEEGMDLGEEDIEGEEEVEIGMDAEMGEPMDGLSDEGAAPDEEMVKRLVSAIAGAIENETGVEVAVEGGEEEPEMELGAAEEGGEDAGEVEIGDMGEEEPAMSDLDEDENFDAYIAEVTRRVAKRIIKKKISK